MAMANHIVNTINKKYELKCLNDILEIQKTLYLPSIQFDVVNRIIEQKIKFIDAYTKYKKTEDISLRSEVIQALGVLISNEEALYETIVKIVEEGKSMMKNISNSIKLNQSLSNTEYYLISKNIGILIPLVECLDRDIKEHNKIISNLKGPHYGIQPGNLATVDPGHTNMNSIYPINVVTARLTREESQKLQERQKLKRKEEIRALKEKGWSNSEIPKNTNPILVALLQSKSRPAPGNTPLVPANTPLVPAHANVLLGNVPVHGKTPREVFESVLTPILLTDSVKTYLRSKIENASDESIHVITENLKRSHGVFTQLIEHEIQSNDDEFKEALWKRYVDTLYDEDTNNSFQFLLIYFSSFQKLFNPDLDLSKVVSSTSNKPLYKNILLDLKVINFYKNDKWKEEANVLYNTLSNAKTQQTWAPTIIRKIFAQSTIGFRTEILTIPSIRALLHHIINKLGMLGNLIKSLLGITGGTRKLRKRRSKRTRARK